jgi:2-methylisocitrate lyase-like PEP mutase family enzyme
MHSSINGKSDELRRLLNLPGIIEAPGCYDVLSALILNHLGFNSIFLSGYGIAASLLGKPDIGITNLVETVAVAKNVVNAIDVPLIVDGDDGYGNENNVKRLVHEIEYIGAAALVLEDQISPKKCGHCHDKKILPLPDYMKKLDCALDSRQTNLVIIARTDEPDLNKAITRAKTFHHAGADVIIIDGLNSLEAIKRVGQEVPGPKQINLIYGGKTPILNLSELEKHGFKIALYSTPTLYVAFNSLLENMALLQKTHDLNSISEQSCNFSSFQEFIKQNYDKK